MKLSFTLLLSLSFLLSFSQTYTSSCVATPQMEGLYRNDAYKAANARLFTTNSPLKDSIGIPVIYRDSVARVLYAIHNMQPSSIKDTILHIFGYSNFGNGTLYEADSLHFTAVSSPMDGTSVKSVEMYSFSAPIPWAADWLAGNYNNTAYPQVNELVNRYQLSVTGNTFGTTTFFRVRSAAALNTRGLAYRFNQLIGSPTACNPGTYIGDGNTIALVYESDGIKITYRHACGDCPAGCNYGRRWTFKVFFATCNVQYLGAENFGAPNPPNLNVYTCIGPILPVTFGTLTGYLQSGKAALNWKVLTQVNVKEYMIERSDNGQQFYTAGTVTANNSLSAEYNWKEGQPLTGTAWYRIKAIDLDGRIKYSPIVKISGAAKGASFTLYPNPVASKTFTVQFATPAAGQIGVNLYSINGKKLWATTLNLAPQTASRTITLPATIQPGMYAFVVESSSGSYRQTLVVAD